MHYATRAWIAISLSIVATIAGTANAQTAAEKIQTAFEKSKSVDSLADYDQLLDLCNEIRGMQLTSAQNDYVRKLSAWGQDRRGELRAARAAELARSGDAEGAAQMDAAALADFEAAVKNDPTRWKAAHNRGVSYAVAGRYDEAINDFSTVIQLNPSHANAWFNRAEIRYELGQFKEALADYNRAVELNPKDAGAYTSRGHAHFALRQFEAGIRDYDQAVRMNRSAETLVDRADAYRSLARWQEAANDYRAAIELGANDARTLQSAAWFMATCPDSRFRNDDLALRAAQRAVELTMIDDWRNLDTLAAAQANAGQWNDAISNVEKALAAAPAEDQEPLDARLKLYQAKQAYRQGMKLR